MALAQQFLDELRARVTLSGLISRDLKLTKAGREFKACCPFHGEKTASFTINDDKQFAHCFGCGWHGDAFRWLQDNQGLDFIEAVRLLAELAGLDMPAPSPEAAVRAARVETVREALDRAQVIYQRQLREAGAVMEYLAGRGIGGQEIETFGIGFARGQDGSLRGSGIGQAVGREAGLLAPRVDNPEELREQFWDRITVPIHDRRGRLIGFGGRVWESVGGAATPAGSASAEGASTRPKFINSPETPLFDKGRNLFNLHRAAALARPGAEGRLVVVEGYFDVVALAKAGIGAAVAPLGTALSEAQLELAWRVHNRPVLLLDGDRAGQAAALRACKTALPEIGPGRELAVAVLPAGCDPDDLVQQGRAGEIEAALLEARPLFAFVFDCLRAAAGDGPEAVAGIWAELSELAGAIRDDETRAQYLGQWRARFDRECSAVPQIAAAEPLHSVTLTAEGDYAFPDSESDSASRLFMLVRAKLKKRAERKAINEELADIDAMAKAIGFSVKEMNAVIRDIESDLAHGSGVREEAEMHRVLYRRTLGVRGPLNEAMLPQLVDARARVPSLQAKRRAAQNALIDARGLEV